MTAAAPPPPTPTDTLRPGLVAVLALAFGLLGQAMTGPSDTLRGLGAILFVRDTLITDGRNLGGIVAGFVAALLAQVARAQRAQAGDLSAARA